MLNYGLAIGWGESLGEGIAAFAEVADASNDLTEKELEDLAFLSATETPETDGFAPAMPLMALFVSAGTAILSF